MDEGISEFLGEIAENMRSPDAAELAGRRAAEIIRGHIYSGNGFDPLSPATEAYRGAGKPLQDTGNLRDSIASEQVSKDTASVGTTAKYAPIQNDGGEIKAKKEWLFIPAAGTRQLERRYGKRPKNVLDGLRGEDFSVFRIGRTVCYRKRGKGNETHVAYFLKKSVHIPARRFFYLSDKEVGEITDEVSETIL